MFDSVIYGMVWCMLLLSVRLMIFGMISFRKGIMFIVIIIIVVISDMMVSFSVMMWLCVRFSDSVMLWFSFVMVKWFVVVYVMVVSSVFSYKSLYWLCSMFDRLFCVQVSIVCIMLK